MLYEIRVSGEDLLIADDVEEVLAHARHCIEELGHPRGMEGWTPGMVDKALRRELKAIAALDLHLAGWTPNWLDCDYRVRPGKEDPHE